MNHTLKKITRFQEFLSLNLLLRSLAVDARDKGNIVAYFAFRFGIYQFDVDRRGQQFRASKRPKVANDMKLKKLRVM